MSFLQLLVIHVQYYQCLTPLGGWGWASVSFQNHQKKNLYVFSNINNCQISWLMIFCGFCFFLCCQVTNECARMLNARWNLSNVFVWTFEAWAGTRFSRCCVTSLAHSTSCDLTRHSSFGVFVSQKHLVYKKLGAVDISSSIYGCYWPRCSVRSTIFAWRICDKQIAEHLHCKTIHSTSIGLILATHHKYAITKCAQLRDNSAASTCQCGKLENKLLPTKPIGENIIAHLSCFECSQFEQNNLRRWSNMIHDQIMGETQ